MIERLKIDLVESGRFGRNPLCTVERYDQLDPKKGVTRPTGTAADKAVRDYAVARMKEAGLSVRIDRLGNIFARRAGVKTNTGTVMCGSHLDSVIDGGQFDGALGVFGAIEAIRRLNDEGYQNARPIEVVVFTGEEGSAFGMTLLGSSALVGKIGVDEALSLENEQGKALEESLKEIDYLGDSIEDLRGVDYFIELHVEQGPILYDEGIPVGIVENISGISWINAIIRGQANHAGTTPMPMRRDALVAASEIVRFVNSRASEMAARPGASTVGTVGKFNVFPNGTNIIPGRVEMGIDIRDVVQHDMDLVRNEVIKAIRSIPQKYNIEVEVSTPISHSPTPLSRKVVASIKDAAGELGIPARIMNSGAGHDAQNMAAKVNTGMIFVPGVNGVSHSPMEWTEWDDIERSVRVLTQTLKNLSQQG